MTAEDTKAGIPVPVKGSVADSPTDLSKPVVMDKPVKTRAKRRNKAKKSKPKATSIITQDDAVKARLAHGKKLSDAKIAATTPKKSKK